MLLDISDLQDETNTTSTELTNRSIHTIKKLLLRKEVMETSIAYIMQDSPLTNQRDIWDLDYKDTSDEEDNDSQDEDDYPKIANKPRINNSEPEQTKKAKPEDVVMKIISRDKSLVRRDLEARLKRIRHLQAQLKKFRKLSSVSAEEFTDFDKTEDYSWWQGIEDNRGIYFALGTKFASTYKKGDQLFNCYGRRTNRFLLVNYGFCMRYNKYNSLGFKVFVNLQREDGNIDETEQFQKIIKMKANKLSLDLLQYLRANLVFSFDFGKKEIRDNITISTPVDLKFETFILE
jgi:hypothetical protein